MTACPYCGHENPAGSKFCNACATALQEAILREERKVVTALFCDLIGFTLTSESADPEDVDRMLATYFRMARTRIEGHGGIVEKFIGDAVVGVFGVPAAHEDDPERAVRAGLRIVEDAEALEALGRAPLRLRVGINTGEAFVRLGIAPGSGEGFLTGGAINTAARLQSVAPDMGVAVGLATYEATVSVFDYEELSPATLKGKIESVRVFRAKAPRSRLGVDLTRTHDTPFVGREFDLALLKGSFDKAIAANSVQFVTVVGEPGLGKSRIVAELGAYVDVGPELVTWRQGRCLPYGDGITFWALGEIVKAHAGILESDPSDAVQAKLDAVLPEGPERAWFRQRLLPLLGIEATSSAGREELFTAWTRFLENIARGGPTILVFEDLHWADEAMLAFLEHLGDQSEAVPLVVIGTGRPELYERRADYAAKLRNATLIKLSALSEEETARLVSALLETTVIPEELRRPILDRAGGNPLYAEEYVRLLKDRDLLVRQGSGWALRDGAEVPFPNTVQALIAARLDTLEPGHKSILADAAVVGKVFWAGAVAQMGERTVADVTEALRELSQKQLVRPARRSSIEGESEYSFWHILARDVAYGQLPKASRVTRHVAAARWITSKASERVEDLADVLAYHYATALEFAQVSGQSAHAAELEVPAIRFLTLAGVRALGLNTAAALENFARALALTPYGHPGRPEALAHFGKAAQQAGRPAEAVKALEEAIASLRERGDLGAVTRAMAPLSIALSVLGDPRWSTMSAEAVALLEPLPPGPELVIALSEMAGAQAVSGRPEEGIRVAERALALGEELGLERSARALGFRGFARSALGDPRGLEDMREAITLATQAGEGREVALLHNNIGVWLWVFEGPAESLKFLRAGIDFARARGLSEMVDGLLAGALDVLADRGEFNEALEVATDLIERLQKGGAMSDLVVVHAVQARALSVRGQAAQVAGSLDWLESTAHGSRTADDLVIGLGSSALAHFGLGHEERAAALLGEVAASSGGRESQYYAAFLTAMVRTALALGDRQLAERLAHSIEPRYPYAEHALVAVNAALAESRGELDAAADAYAESAERWERFGVIPECGFALLGYGRCLLRLARPSEAQDILRGALDIFERLGAQPALAETDSLLLALTAVVTENRP